MFKEVNYLNAPMIHKLWLLKENSLIILKYLHQAHTILSCQWMKPQLDPVEQSLFNKNQNWI